MRNDDRETRWAGEMRAALAGSRPAYERLLRDLVPELRRDIAAGARLAAGARSVGFDPADVEDVVQETLLAIHVKRRTWDPARPLTPWVRAIARFKLVDALRRRARRGVEVDVAVLADALPAAEERLDDRLAPIERGLAALPPRQRQVVEALTLQGASVGETASRLAMTHVAVRVSLHRGLTRLAARFSGQASAERAP